MLDAFNLNNLTQDQTRLAWSAGWAALFGVTCVWAAIKRRSRSISSGDYLVLYASQTGQAEEIARKAAKALVAGGRDAHVVSTAAVTVAQLQSAKYILVVASTTGEGDAPDEALKFERALMAQRPDLSGKQFAVYALGDRKYEAFCAFGIRIFDWLAACGGVAMTPVIEANDLDPASWAQWHSLIERLGGHGADTEEAGLPWRLDSRMRLNPLGGNALYHLSFVCDDMPDWQAGDLIEIVTPNGHRRDYSIATLPAEGRLDLYVREVVRTDGTYGDGSGLLIQRVQPGESLSLRIKSHRNFHAPEGEGPLLLVGAGSGLAGLRAHILKAGETRRPVWLIYGERHPMHDAKLTNAMRDWRDKGLLNDLDFAFSRPDDGQGRYVQAVVAERRADIAAYLKDGGAIMVCGGLDMGLGVEAALVDIMGQAWVDDAKVSGRYRRDLY